MKEPDAADMAAQPTDRSIQKNPERSELPTVTSSIGNMLFEPDVFERVTQMADIMAKSKAMVPQYLRGNQSDCMAIIMQAAQWRMDAFAVAAKTYQIKPGAPIAYEAQLVNSIIIKNGPFKERPQYSFFGDWSRVQGKLKEMRSDKGKYAVPDWKPDDEEGLGVTVTVHVVGEDEPTSMDVLLKQCWPRNSTNWAYNPQQQICYSGIRMMARRHFPDVIMGLYTPDELTHVQPPEKDITPNNSVEDLLPSKSTTPAEDHFTATVAPLLADIENASTPEELNRVGEVIKTKGEHVQAKLRPVYRERKRALTPKAEPKDDEQAETIDKETGEVKGDDHGPVDPATLMKMAETADSKESIEDILDMASNMDKRSKAYKDLVAFLEIRHAEIAENAASE